MSRAFWQGFFEGVGALPRFLAEILTPHRSEPDFSLESAFAEADFFVRAAMFGWEASHGSVAPQSNSRVKSFNRFATG